MKTQNITLTFSIDTLNIIVNALGHRPYIEVKDIIENISIQAKNQLNQNSIHDDKIEENNAN